MTQKKRRQHYVFQRYLSAWTVNGKLWCKRDGKVFSTGTDGIANERDFYRSRPLNSDESKLYNLLFRKDIPEVQQARSIHMNAYLQPILWKERVSQLRLFLEREFGDYSHIPTDMQSCLEKLEQRTENAVNNTNEDYYSIIESDGAKWLDQLKNHDTSFYYTNRCNIDELEYYDDEQFHFIVFVCMQYFRTKAIRDRWIASFAHCMEDPRFDYLNIPRENIDLMNIQPHLIWDLQNRTAFFLRKQDAPLSLLVNETNIPFVTSDQPVINLCADYQKPDEDPSELVFYYPISPTVAILLNSKEAQRKAYLTEEQVDSYNNAIIRASYQNIISNQRDAIERYNG